MLKMRIVAILLIVCMLLPCFTVAQIADIIVDNSNSELFSTTGSWKLAKNAASENGDYLSANDTYSTATWRFKVPMQGNYDIYIIYPAGNAKNVPVEVSQDGGIVVGNSLRQDQCPNEWHYLGKYYFTPETDSYVKISSDGAVS